MRIYISLLPLVLTLVLTLLGVTLLYAMHQHLTREQLISTEQHHLSTALLEQHALLQGYLLRDDVAALKNWAALKSESPHIRSVLVVSPAWQILAAHQVALEDSLLSNYDAALQQQLQQLPAQSLLSPLTLPQPDPDVLHMALPLQFNSQQGWLLIQYDMKPALQDGLTVTLQNMLVYLFSMLLSGVLTYLLLRNILHTRLQRLETALHQYSRGEHQTRTRVEDNNEFGRLELMLNQTFDALDQQREMRRHSELFNQLVLNSTTDGIISADTQGRILQVNQSALKIFGYQHQDDLAGQDLNLLIPPCFRPGHQDHLATARQKPEGPQHVLNRLRQVEGLRKDGSLVPLDITLTKAELLGQTIYIAFLKDNSEQRRYQQSIETLAFKDNLTGCANLNGLKRQAATRPDLHWMYLLNIDGMSNLNHSLGFDIGDQLIKTSSLLLKQHKPAEALLARHEGTDFILLSPQQPQQMLAIFRELQQQDIKLDGINHKLSFCVVYQLVNPELDFDRQLHGAELMMRQAKANGRASMLQVEPGLIQQLQQNAVLCQRLELAIREQQLFFHFQPKFSALSRQPVSAEALIRWQPDGQLISPGLFIPLAEQSHLMPELDRYVIASACQQIRRWLDQGYQVLPLSINLSARYLTDEQTISFIFQQVGEFDIPAHLLEIEVTEYSLISDEQRTADNMYRLQKAGITLAIDDYGTGHSNLATVLSLPVQNLKIDQSFIRKGMSSSKGRAVLENILQLAKSLQVTTTAEGVETEEQLQYLQRSGCEFIQGYLLSRPLSLADYETLLRRQQTTAH
jgi:PAS domain S-box-containing protein/diguanylate cyclase (GGDEF)-like protein